MATQIRRCIAPTLLLTALLAMLPARIAAAGEAAMPRFFGRFATTVGGWSEYAVTETETGKASTMRSAVVGKEDDAFWYEIVITEGGARNVIKMFLSGDPNNPENIKRLIMKNGDQPAQEMPRDFVVLGRRMASHMFEARSGSPAVDRPGITVEEAGSREVTVPAGTFTAVLNRIKDAGGEVLATFDIAKEVLPFGVVRSETPKVRMELLAHGTDATSVITEEPQMMTMPPGMPEGNPRGMPPGMGKLGGAPATGGYGAPAPASGGYGAPPPASGGYR